MTGSKWKEWLSHLSLLSVDMCPDCVWVKSTFHLHMKDGKSTKGHIHMKKICVRGSHKVISSERLCSGPLGEYSE